MNVTLDSRQASILRRVFPRTFVYQGWSVLWAVLRLVFRPYAAMFGDAWARFLEGVAG